MKDIFGREIVRETTGQMVGVVHHTPNINLVCQPTGPANGFTQNGGTFDMVGRRKLTSEQPAWLIGHDESDDEC